ncbi:hypothetical protein FDA94_26645 [Herbidospora galbida]|uniref:Tetratricopeptide repeat protein n=1 Tax=Herbidospora galbida TaxID=2575442 RepID=A0A4U3M8P9_9ACTN|nr:hypothetical protein [Herbidospora galbida]TKK85251.1 hypothetical protein FDA94_26645 [Herbidospora galbida]
MRPGQTMGLCLVAGVGEAHGHLPERILRRAGLTQVVEAACARSGLRPPEYLPDGVCLTVADRSAADVRDLVRDICGAVRTEIRTGGGFRLALTAGLILPPGVAGQALAEAVRLLDSPEVRSASRRLPPSPLTVVVSDTLFHDAAASPADFHRVRLTRGHAAVAWLYAPDLPESVSAATSAGTGRTALPLIRRARRMIAKGDQDGPALHLLERALRLLPAPDGSSGETALLLLGDCHARLGQAEAAAQSWRYLLRHRSLCWPAYQRLGHLELGRARPDLAVAYLSAALRITRAHPDAVTDGTQCALLLGLCRAYEQLGDDRAADASLNDAADADPPNPLPFVARACRAAAHGDVQAVRQLLATALLRVSREQRTEFLRKHFQGVGSWKGGDLIVGVLSENGFDTTALNQPANIPRPPAG